MVKKNLFTFVLDVDWRQLLDKKGTQQDSNISDETIIADLDNTTEDKSYYFVDNTKNKIKLQITMIDIVSQKSIPLVTDIPCWWCRHTFKTCPIGLPLRYNSESSQLSLLFKKYLNENNMTSETTDFFETEGIFCSFPCCKAYILDQSFNTKYKRSNTLLYLMYYKIFGIHQNIPRAPTWKLLQQAGGPLSITSYRSNFEKLIYNSIPNLKRPFMFTTGEYYEEIKVK